MLGAWSARELAGSRRAATGSARRIAARSASRTAIEDGPSALQSSAWSHVARARFGWWQNGRLVYGPRSGLRHHHAANRRRWRGRSLCRRAFNRSCRGLSRDGGNRGIQLRRSYLNRNRSCLYGSDRCGFRWSLSDGRCGGLRGCRSNQRLCDYGRLFSSSRRFFFWSSRGWLDDHSAWRRRNDHNWARNCAHWSLRNHRTGWRFGGNGRCRRLRDDVRGRTRLWNDLAWGGRRWRSGDNCRLCGDNRRRHSGRWCCRLGRHVRVPRFFLFFFLLRQNGLQHVAGLGDVREVDFWCDGLLSARGRGAAMAGRARSALKLRANLVGFITLKAAGVGLACAQAEFRQYVKNLSALDFHLAREIVDTNLTHPPLFENPIPRAASRS